MFRLASKVKFITSFCDWLKGVFPSECDWLRNYFWFWFYESYLNTALIWHAILGTVCLRKLYGIFAQKRRMLNKIQRNKPAKLFSMLNSEKKITRLEGRVGEIARFTEFTRIF